MTAPCPDCNGTGHVSADGGPRGPGAYTAKRCPSCEGTGTIATLFFSCPTCHGFEHDRHCPDPNHGLHGPVTLARLERFQGYDWWKPAVPVFRKVAEWQAP